MRIEQMKVIQVNDPIICRGGDTKMFTLKRYVPLAHPQLLSIFRTDYTVSHTLIANKYHKKVMLNQAKFDAYKQHLREIEHALHHSKGGESIRTIKHVNPCPCCEEEDCKHAKVEFSEMPYRQPYGYSQFLDAGANINDEVVLLALWGRCLKHFKRVPSACDTMPDSTTYTWLSEVALGLAKNHKGEREIPNPFKLGWRYE